MNRIAVVTAITGGYDDLVPHPKDDSVDWIALVDHPVEHDGGWDVRVHRVSGHPRMAVKEFRMKHHLLLPEYDYTIAIDGNIHVKDGVQIGEMADWVTENPLALFRHADRNDLVDEAHFSQRVPKYHGGLCDIEGIAYAELGMPRHWGLWWCGLVVRRQCPEVAAFMDRWYNEVAWWSTDKVVVNDQISFPWVAYQMDMRPNGLPVDTYANRHVENRWTYLGTHLRND